MLKKQVKIGNSYRAKISEKLVTVRILHENRYGGWDALNLVTNRVVRIKSAAKLRSEVFDSLTDAELRSADAIIVEDGSCPTQCPLCGEISSKCDCDF